MEAKFNFHNQRPKHMNDSNEEQLDINTDRAKSTEVVQAAKPDQFDESMQLTTPVTPRKGWHFISLIFLMPLGAIGVVLYLLRHVFTADYEGLGAALCAVACGGFLVRHVIHLFAEEDKMQDQQRNANQATVLPLKPNPTELQINPSAQPPGPQGPPDRP
jgi:hypothetical protein